MTRRSSHPPISDYGLIGNRHTCALVDRGGSIDWCCLPHLDDPSVFGALLDLRRGGHWRIAPVEGAPATRFYVGASAVLVSEFESPTGRLRLTDFLPIRRGRGDEPSYSAHTIIRIAEVVEGEVAVEAEWCPRPNYGRDDVRLAASEGLVTAAGAALRLWLRAPSGTHWEVEDAAARATVLLRKGERWSVLSGVGDPDPAPPDRSAERQLRETLAWWEEWRLDCRFEPGMEGWREQTLRSGMVLKLLSNEKSGAIAAAPTTSLPEDVGGVRNWDYRFCWVRDASMISQALTMLGQRQEGIAFLEFLERTAQQHNDPARVQVLYGMSGQTTVTEYDLGHLDGYRDSRPVRVGNAAALQRQLDVYGELMCAAYDLVKMGVALTPAQRDWLRRVADYICEVWRLPDRGIWEVRGPERHFTYSKLMCWTGLDRAIALAPRCGWAPQLRRWQGERRAIREAILENGYDAARGSFVQSFGSRSLDASNLLLPRLGFLPARDPRVLGTIDATLRELTENGLVHRYAVEATDDGVSGCEGAFGICTFWLCDALAMAGRLEEAEGIFAGMLARGNDLGLYPEEIDPATGDFLGNYPQAFTHVGLINSAFCLAGARADTGTPDGRRTISRDASP